MAYVPLNPADIAAGKPTKEELFTTIKANQDDFDSRITAAAGGAVLDIFNIKFGGAITQYTMTEISERIPVYKAPVAGTIVSFVMTLLTASTSGNLEFNIEISTDDGVNWNTLLNNPVQLTGTTVGSLSGTVDWISAASQDFDQGDLLRITPTGTQVDQGEFQVAIYGELA